MDEPLGAHTPNEIEYYLLVANCAKCGHGPFVIKNVRSEGDGGAAAGSRGAAIRTRCRRCGAQTTFHFRWDGDAPDPADEINPTGRPSRIIDLGQWVGLYHVFREQSSSAESPAETRRAARKAAMCLAEALRFYSQEELPPDSAFFCEASRAAFQENRANFARTRLRELQALLPTFVDTAARPRETEADPPAHGQLPPE
ncbi:MAG TPA: hypothetical protein VM695_10315 [Phycisphaerae bacterium]|nr:hypothetical protein [Phycisphaerae bacterium]